jgi:hypothetical protein
MLTRAEVLKLLRDLALVEGFLFSVKDSTAVLEEIQGSINLLIRELQRPG